MFERLDFVYTPSRDTAADAEHATGVLGGRLVFAIEAFGARVAMVRFAEDGPAVLYADHLEGERPILVFRVGDLEAAVAALEGRGVAGGHRFEIPPGPGFAWATPAGHRLAVYALTRPGVLDRFEGRHDF
jgi:hypothetical protein